MLVSVLLLLKSAGGRWCVKAGFDVFLLLSFLACPNVFEGCPGVVSRNGFAGFKAFWRSSSRLIIDDEWHTSMQQKAPYRPHRDAP